MAPETPSIAVAAGVDSIGVSYGVHAPERLRRHSMEAHRAVARGEENPLIDLVVGDEDRGG